MQELLTILNRFFDIFPSGACLAGRYIYIGVISVVSAIIFLVLFKRTSNQTKIKAHKNQVFGNILQMRIYKDRFGLLVLSVVNVMRYNILYIKQTIIPFVIICIPLIVLTVQINNRCGYQPLHLNDSFVVQVKLDSTTVGEEIPAILSDIYCKTSPGVVLETPPLRISSQGEVFWRARVADIPGDNRSYLRVGIQGEKPFLEKEIAIGDKERRFAATVEKWSFWSGLFNNAEGFLPNGGLVKSVSVGYSRAGYPFIFWDLDSVVIYLILTLVFALCFKPFIKVVI